jgi:hypothetical protein
MSAEPERRSVARWQAPVWVIWILALAGPGLLTAVLVQFSSTEKRNYVFPYLGVVAVVGVLRGFWPALLAAGVSFALLDYFFTVPYYTFTMSKPADVVNLLVFVVAAALVGVLAAARPCYRPKPSPNSGAMSIRGWYVSTRSRRRPLKLRCDWPGVRSRFTLSRRRSDCDASC